MCSDYISLAVFIGVFVLYICGLKAQDEREYQNDRDRCDRFRRGCGITAVESVI